VRRLLAAVVALVVGGAATGVIAAPAGAALLGGNSAAVSSASMAALGYDAVNDTGSLSSVTRIIGAQDLWAAGYTGNGVGVALIDTGVTPVSGLAGAGQVVNGPDLSFDSQSSSLAHLDTFGHGTHMAGIIAGRDPGVTASALNCATCLNSSGYSDATKFVGVAPDAHIVNVKVGATDGAADVSQVIAAIDWVVQHKNDPGMNIKVLNLSYGTNSAQPASIDPIAYAAEVAWRNGIVVVAAGGNDGKAVPTLADPAYSPSVIAVGADDPMGTQTRVDDTVPDFATHGTVERPVDVIAPGTHVLSLRVPGSFIDTNAPGGVVGTRFQRGTGTSQSAAAVSGLVALLEQRFPQATPDQIKALLMKSAYRINANLLFAGKGIVDGANANLVGSLGLTGLTDVLTPNGTPGTGTGSLEASRGASHVSDAGVMLQGEQDIFGQAFDSAGMAALEARRASWTGGTWNRTVWTGNGWTGGAWPTTIWTGTDWAGSRWRTAGWDSAQWDGSRWRSSDWSGSRWRSSEWSDATWSGSRWR
jgi:serine protease AprX